MRYLLLPLRLLQPHGVPGTPTCKYHPSCSRYAADAVRRHGAARGSAKAAWRFLRCNPWSHGGFDPA